YRGPNSIITNFPDLEKAESGAILNHIVDFNSVGGIYPVDLEVIDASPAAFSVQLANTTFVPGTSHFFGRFLPYNIMHTIHDDLQNVFYTLIQYTGPTYEDKNPH